MKCCEECPGDDTCEHAKYCVCGDAMDRHNSMWSGHSAVSMHDYACDGIAKQLKATPRVSSEQSRGPA